jgi:hypothetical protein
MSLDGPEIEKRHRSGALPVWLEWLTSISALVVSVCSIFIAVHNGHDEDKMVQAQSYPYLDMGRNDRTLDGGSQLSVTLLNRGVGPAHEESFRVRDGNHFATTLDELIAGAVGPADAKAARATLDPLTSGMLTRFIPANTNQFIFQIDRTDANARWWDKLDEASHSWRLEVCYCSVFKECWTRLNQAPPEPVKACQRDEATEYRN